MNTKAKTIIALLCIQVLFLDLVPRLTRWCLAHGAPIAIGDVALGPVYSLLFFACATFVFVGVLRSGRLEYGIRRASRSDFFSAILFFGLLFFLAVLGRILDPGFDAPYARQAGLQTLSGLWLFLVVLPIPLLQEELFLRFTQRHLETLVGIRWAVILLSANFASMHYPMGFSSHAVFVLPSVFLASGVLAVFFAATRNLWLVYGIHVLFDAIIALQIFLHVSGNVLGETILWVLYGGIGVYTFRRAWVVLKKTVHAGGSYTQWPVRAIALAVAIAFPLLFLFGI